MKLEAGLRLFLYVSLSLARHKAAAGAESDTSSVTKNWHYLISMDSRSTIIDGRHIRINGLLTGMSIGEKNHKITLGYYWLGYDASRRLIDWHKKLTQSINLSYYIKTDVSCTL